MLVALDIMGLEAGGRGIIATVTPVTGLNPIVSVAALGAELVTPVKNSNLGLEFQMQYALKLDSHYTK